jgi:uncharacterized protein YlxW (UPF0749 family)
VSTPLRRLLSPRVTRAQLVVALLCALVGFALAVQVRTSGSDAGRRATRPEDLARILDDLGSRSDRLRTEIDTLRVTRDRLASGTDRSQTALIETQRRAQELGILGGTLPAAGPGVIITISDPDGKVRADVVLDAVEELRDAGAEALQIAGANGKAVRIVAGTAFEDDPTGGILADDGRVTPTYRLTAIGDPATLAPAMRIPGGVVDTIDALPAARVVLATASAATVAALHRLQPPRYARPAATASQGG